MSPSYRHLKRLQPGQGTGPAVVIGTLESPAAADAAVRHGLTEPTRAGDRLLLEASAAGDDGAFLCLRCLVSEPLEQKIRAIHRERGRDHDLDLITLAGFALDDSGELLDYGSLKALAEAAVRPFTAQVVCSYDPARAAGLPHWARTKLQACNELKAYLRQHGVLLISEWALLADSSPKRVREAMQLFGSAALTADRGVALHAAYRQAYGLAKAVYVERTGKQSGWLPDEAFLLQIAPEMAADTTRECLLAIDRAIRRLLTQRGMASLEELGEQGIEAIDPSSLACAGDGSDSDDAAAQLASIHAALDRACGPLVHSAIATDQPQWGKSPERLQAWQLYAQGAGQRAIAEATGKGQAWVSKLLKEKSLSAAIATAAAVELKRLPAFCAIGSSVEGAERLVEALRNHLITPEREGDIAPLRRAVAHVLVSLSR